MNMNSIDGRATTTGAACYPIAYAIWIKKRLELAVDVSKTSLDLAVAQNAEVLASYKKTLKASSIPGLFLFDLGGQALEGYVTLQKTLMDLALEQSTAVLEVGREYKRDGGKVEAATSHAMQPTEVRKVAAEKSVLDDAAKQTKAVSDTGKQQPVVLSSPVQTANDIDQLRVDTLLAKEIVDLIVQPDVTGAPTEAVADIVQLQVDSKEIVDHAAKPFKVSDVN